MPSNVTDSVLGEIKKKKLFSKFKMAAASVFDRIDSTNQNVAVTVITGSQSALVTQWLPLLDLTIPFKAIEKIGCR
jgi:hypothetical protein